MKGVIGDMLSWVMSLLKISLRKLRRVMPLGQNLSLKDWTQDVTHKRVQYSHSHKLFFFFNIYIYIYMLNFVLFFFFLFFPFLKFYICFNIGERDVISSLKDESKSKWKSRDEVEANLGSLGDGISVFFIYAPNPDDPYKEVSSQDSLEQRNQYLMCRLFFDLERHGFHVVSDLHLGDTEPANWLHWYVTRILHCNFVIFVCSPAFKELFQETPRVDRIVNNKARKLLEYSNAIYSGVSQQLSGACKRRKFLPVILDDYRVDECVPTLFECGAVFSVKHEESQRKFNYDDKDRGFEKLICYMAGVNRVKLEQPQKGEIITLGDLTETSKGHCMLCSYHKTSFFF